MFSEVSISTSATGGFVYLSEGCKRQFADELQKLSMKLSEIWVLGKMAEGCLNEGLDRILWFKRIPVNGDETLYVSLANV